MKKLILGVINILILQVILFIIPVMFADILFQGIAFGLNVALTWKFIKKIEMGYYNKYNKFNSMLYMICPVIGISLIMWLLYILTKELYLVNYYISLIICVYIFNLVYIIGNKIKK